MIWPLRRAVHVRKHGVGCPDDAQQVHGDLSLDVFYGVEGLKPIETAKASIVEENVNLTIGGEGGADHGVDLGRLGDIEGNRQSLPAVEAYLLSQFLEAVEAAGGEHREATLASKKLRGCCAEAGGCACNDHDLAGEGWHAGAVDSWRLTVGSNQ